MGIISMSGLIKEFNPNMSIIAALLPDVKYISLEFAQPHQNGNNPLHSIVIARYLFQNKLTLSVPGYMLWKFQDNIPDALGNQVHGYFDENPYSTDHPERLMRRIRASHSAMFISGHYGLRRPILAATLSIQQRDIIVEYA